MSSGERRFGDIGAKPAPVTSQVFLPAIWAISLAITHCGRHFVELDAHYGELIA